MSIKRMDLNEFVDFGYLQELNRQFLHPLGLALEVIQEDDGSISGFGGVWDYRDDPEGMIFGEEMMDEGFTEKFMRVDREWTRMGINRKESLGYMVQPMRVVEQMRHGEKNDK